MTERRNNCRKFEEYKTQTGEKVQIFFNSISSKFEADHMGQTYKDPSLREVRDELDKAAKARSDLKWNLVIVINRDWNDAYDYELVYKAIDNDNRSLYCVANSAWLTETAISKRELPERGAFRTYSFDDDVQEIPFTWEYWEAADKIREAFLKLDGVITEAKEANDHKALLDMFLKDEIKIITCPIVCTEEAALDTEQKIQKAINGGVTKEAD